MKGKLRCEWETHSSEKSPSWWPQQKLGKTRVSTAGGARR